MKPTQSFNSYIENSIKDNWDRDALTDYKGATLQYHDVARKIAKLHILFRHSGLQPGDKVALCGRNSSAWAAAFLATITYGAVAVPIQHEFTPDMVYNIVNHSESRLLFVGDVVSPTIDAGEMPALEGIIYIPDFSLTMSRSETLTFAREHLNKLFGEEYPKAFERSHVSYHQDSPEELALINYTSGTTGFSKGVMLPYRALWSNLYFTMRSLGANMAPGSNVLCTLPMAHMYGMMVEFFLNFCLGNHLFFLTRLPSPSLIQSACADIHPAIVIVVPMVIEKIIRKMVFPLIQQRYVHLLLNMPAGNKKIKARILQQVKDIFGGQLFEMMFGGAGLNREVEDFLRHIGFPLAVGYGTTETAPLITSTATTATSCAAPADGWWTTWRYASPVPTQPTCRARSSRAARTSCWATTRIPRPATPCSTRTDGFTPATSPPSTVRATSSSADASRTCFSAPTDRTSIPRRSKTSSTR